MPICRICKRELPLDAFGPAKKRKNGVRSECRECRRHPRQPVPDELMHAEYRYIRVNGRHLLVHRYVMEQKLGRPLERFEFVHHINGDTLDNRPENLELVTPKIHSNIHNGGKPIPDETRQKMSKSHKGKKYPHRKAFSPESNQRRSESVKRAHKEHPERWHIGHNK